MSKRGNLVIKLKTIFLVTAMGWLLPIISIAQYNPQQKDDVELTTIIVQYAIEGIKMLVGFIIVAAILKLIIAAIIYITSGGDEDRVDTAWTWTKQSTLSIVIVTLVYVGIDMIK